MSAKRLWAFGFLFAGASCVRTSFGVSPPDASAPATSPWRGEPRRLSEEFTLSVAQDVRRVHDGGYVAVWADSFDGFTVRLSATSLDPNGAEIRVARTPETGLDSVAPVWAIGGNGQIVGLTSGANNPKVLVYAPGAGWTESSLNGYPFTPVSSERTLGQPTTTVSPLGIVTIYWTEPASASKTISTDDAGEVDKDAGAEDAGADDAGLPAGLWSVTVAPDGTVGPPEPVWLGDVVIVTVTSSASETTLAAWSTPGGDVLARRKLDGGWGTSDVIVGDASAAPQFFPYVNDPGDALVLFLFPGDIDPNTVNLYSVRSHDGGWSTVEPLPTNTGRYEDKVVPQLQVGISPTLAGAIDPQGSAHLVWLVDAGSATRLVAAHAAPGAEWTDDGFLDEPVSYIGSRYPRVDTNSAGTAIVTWESPGRIQARRFTNDAGWGATWQIDAGPFAAPAVAIDEGGRAVITYGRALQTWIVAVP
ncbi:MAG: hypothetical protein HYY84_04795 [Deltaproteobacteria bacterium]|nr:hypothetical protein [Deltaproteobacteria bacterium]